MTSQAEKNADATRHLREYSRLGRWGQIARILAAPPRRTYRSPAGSGLGKVVLHGSQPCGWEVLADYHVQQLNVDVGLYGSFKVHVDTRMPSAAAFLNAKGPDGEKLPMPIQPFVVRLER